MPTMEPNKDIRIMHDTLLKAGGGHRKRGQYTLDLMPDGSWELSRYAGMIYIIDSKGHGRVFTENRTLPEMRAINSLSILVTEEKAFATMEEFQEADR